MTNKPGDKTNMTKSAMSPEFRAAFREQEIHNWLSFIGMPMLYCAGLFVTREEASST